MFKDARRIALAAAIVGFASTPALDVIAATSAPELVWGAANTGGGWAVQTGPAGNTTTLATDSFPPQALEFDPLTQRIYWHLRDFSPNGFVRSTLLDGSDFQEAQANLPSGLALDPANNLLFLTEQASHQITRYSLDLNNPAPTPVFTDGIILPSEIDLDAASDTLFFVNTTGSQGQTGAFSIESISTAGNNRQVLATSLIQVTGLALDSNAGKVYWADLGVNGVADTRIGRMNFDGTQPETILTNLPDIVLDMEIDQGTGRLYWTSRDEGQIKSATLEGLDIQAEVTGLSQPHGLALIPEPTSLAIVSLLSIATLRRRRA